MRRMAAPCFPLAIASLAVAGAFGVGSFENDYATDWVATLVRGHDTTGVYATLERAQNEPLVSEMSADTSIAAAEVVAAMLGRPARSLPTGLTEWLKLRAEPPTESQVALTRQVLQRVLDAKSSELAAFWERSGYPEAKEWRANIMDLLDRLATTNRSSAATGRSHSPVSPAHVSGE